MKKSLLMLPFLAAALWSCSNDKSPMGEVETGEAKYMAVSIATSFEAPAQPASVSRADGEYEDGTADENAVETLDFYFFNADKTPAKVKANGTNYFRADIKPGDKESENVEKTLKAVVVINASDKSEPYQIVAVINGGEEGAYANISLDKLQEEIAAGKVNGKFTMTNSVYAENNQEIVGVPVEGHIYTTEAAALGNPVTIHVERLLAKVRVNSSIKPVKVTADGEYLYSTRGKDKEESTIIEKYDGKEIYVKFLGWNVVAESNNERLVKKINPAWLSIFTKWTDWNKPEYFRCFWAINAESNTYSWGDFNSSTDDHAAFKNTSFFTVDGGNEAYMKENAGNTDAGVDSNTPYQTKVIIAAQLVDETGAPMEFAEWGFFDRMSIDDLRKAIADVTTLYTPITDAQGQPGFAKITPEDIQLLTAREGGKVAADATVENSKGSYLVYGGLSEVGKEKTWYKSNAENAEEADSEYIQNLFNSFGGAKVWKNGYTYYYFSINHLAPSGSTRGMKGVVRNHLYDTNLSTLTGLGTPVYNPEEIIYPEKPTNDNSFIAAEVKILSWRVVPQSVDLEW